MDIPGKAAIVATALMLTAAASACTGSAGQQSSTNVGSSTTAHGKGTSPSGNGTSTAGGNLAQGGTTTRGSSHSSGSTGTEAATNNRVLLGVAFFGTPAPISFGSVLPGESKTLQVAIANGPRPATIVSVTADRPEFSPSGNCNMRALKSAESCIISITFSPTAVGTYDATLTITVDPSRLTTEPSLEGSAGPPSSPSQAVSPTPSAGSPAPSDQSS
jgi:Abnormal spindle-like microcephaly-assoc'd, ASPM-SPD-2-Hydin